jgi:predicted SAM-dependent methyltransferase
LPDIYLENFDRYQYIHSIFQAETLNIFQYSCPVCTASDRNRLYALFLKKYLDEHQHKLSFLDIAPDSILRNWLKKNPFLNYRSADKYMENVDDKLDITNLSSYENDKFDIILCSHVLEHIENDRSAISELYRVLKPGGIAVVMVPILLSLEKDYENPEIKTEAERWKHFGQNDHVRMYSKSGFVNKLEQAGFKVNQSDKNDVGEDVFIKNGIHLRSVLYTAEK